MSRPEGEGLGLGLGDGVGLAQGLGLGEGDGLGLGVGRNDGVGVGVGGVGEGVGVAPNGVGKGDGEGVGVACNVAGEARKVGAAGWDDAAIAAKRATMKESKAVRIRKIRETEMGADINLNPKWVSCVAAAYFEACARSMDLKASST